MSGGALVGAEQTLYSGTQVPWLTSSQVRRKAHGVTMRAASVVADGNGNKIVPSGTVVGERDSGGLFDEVVAAVAASKTTGLVASDNAIKFTASTAGTAGNAIKLELVNDLDSRADSVVEYDSYLNKVLVHCKNDGSDVTALASEVIAAFTGGATSATLTLGASNSKVKVTRRLAGYLADLMTLQLINAGPNESLAVDVVDGYRIQVTLATAGTNEAVAASKTLWDSVENKELVVTADAAGIAGNDLSLELLNSGPNNSLAVNYDDGVISVVLETDDTSEAVAASKVFDSGVTNKELTITAKAAGAAGNDLSIELLDPGQATQTLSVDYDDGVITVNLATNGESTITSTAKDVADAIMADVEAKALVTAAYDGTGLEVIGAQTEAALTGGSDEGSGTIVSTVAEVAAAINADVECKALVTASYDGTGAEAAEAAAEASLTGGTAEGSGVITSTAAQVIAALNAEPEAKALIYAENGADSTGAGTVAAASETALAGGNDAAPITAANATGSDGSGAVLAVAETTLASGTDQNVTAEYITAEAVELTNGDNVVAVFDQCRVREALLNTTVDATIKAQLVGVTFE